MGNGRTLTKSQIVFYSTRIAFFCRKNNPYKRASRQRGIPFADLSFYIRVSTLLPINYSPDGAGER